MERRNHYCSLVEGEYRKALDRLTRVTPVSACHRLLEEANRNEDTHTLIIHSMLPALFNYAMQIHPRDPMDLVSVGNLTLMEKWEQAMYEEAPIRYLFNSARMAMYTYLRQYGRGPLTFPDSGDIEIPTLEFFHINLCLDTDDEPEYTGDACEFCPFDPAPLYEAVASLRSLEARTLVERLFGLFGNPEETLLDITGGDWKGREYCAKRTMKYSIMKRLKAYLIKQYPDFVEAHACASLEEKVQARAYVRLYEIGKIPVSTRKRLDQARERIESRGEPLTLKWLRIEAACGSAAAQAYMYELRVSHA